MQEKTGLIMITDAYEHKLLAKIRNAQFYFHNQWIPCVSISSLTYESVRPCFDPHL